jgi:hypothetical protein
VAAIKKNQLLAENHFIKFSDMNFANLAQKMISQNLVLVTGYDELLKLAEQDCRISLSRERWTGFLETFAISKDFRYTKQFDLM